MLAGYIQKISKIRDRGQMTVPLEIRKVLDWSEKEVIIKMETIPSGFKVERLPASHPQNPKKHLTAKQWGKIFSDMKRISKLGKKKRLTNFLRKDREGHF